MSSIIEITPGKHIVYECQGTCSKAITVEAKDGVIENVTFFGGCSGNLAGISKLVRGMRIDDVISRLEGTPCKNHLSSCPDQLSKALRLLKESGE